MAPPLAASLFAKTTTLSGLPLEVILPPLSTQKVLVSLKVNVRADAAE
jgi:hypothetical protein